MVSLRLIGQGSATDTECARVRERFRGFPERVDHVHAQPAECGMDLVVFVVASDIETAEGHVRHLCREVLGDCDPPLTVRDCAVDLFLPGMRRALTDGT
jgi:hypothetical protein